jgi:hypothetical protein
MTLCDIQIRCLGKSVTTRMLAGLWVIDGSLGNVAEETDEAEREGKGAHGARTTRGKGKGSG